MNVEFITIRENGFRSFEEKCRELWKEGWRPLFPHTAHVACREERRFRGEILEFLRYLHPAVDQNY
jgi:hypothetical protein